MDEEISFDAIEAAIHGIAERIMVIGIGIAQNELGPIEALGYWMAQTLQLEEQAERLRILDNAERSNEISVVRTCNDAVTVPRFCFSCIAPRNGDKPPPIETVVVTLETYYEGRRRLCVAWHCCPLCGRRTKILREGPLAYRDE